MHPTNKLQKELMLIVLPVAVHVQQTCEDEENEGRKDSNEDPHRLLSVDVCQNRHDTRASTQQSCLFIPHD